MFLTSMRLNNANQWGLINAECLYILFSKRRRTSYTYTSDNSVTLSIKHISPHKKQADDNDYNNNNNMMMTIKIVITTTILLLCEEFA